MNEVRGVFEGEQPVICLSGQISSDNAAQVEEQIADLLKDYAGKTIRIDVRDLQYISSAGLRVLLRLQKSHKDITITEPNSEIYDILDMTGFTQIKNAVKEDSLPSAGDEIDIEATEDNLHRVLDFVGEYLEKADCEMQMQVRIQIAVEEIFINIARYAYEPNTGRARIRLSMSEDRSQVRITFIDCGKPYDPLAKEDPDVTLPAEEREIGGLGIFMTKQIMDTVEYEYRDGKNILVLGKNLI